MYDLPFQPRQRDFAPASSEADMQPIPTQDMAPRTPTPVHNLSSVPPLVELDVTWDEDRRKSSFLAGKNKTYQPQIYYDDAGPFDDPDIFGAAPWLDKTAVLDGYIILHSTSNGFFPGGIPLSVKRSESLRHQFCYYDDELRVDYGSTIAGVSVDFSKAANAGLNHFLMYTPLPENIRSDLFRYQIQLEYFALTLLERQVD